MINSLLTELGSNFRGLWTSVIVFDSYGGLTTKQDWTVTYLLNGDYVETPGFETPEKALQFAIEMKRNNSSAYCPLCGAQGHTP